MVQLHRTGRAGPRDPKSRSDLFVEIESRKNGGIELNLVSKVAALYGERIEEQVRALISDFGVTDARVVVEDRGALPFVIAARTEAALLDAGFTGSSLAAPRARPAPSTKTRARRSRLYLPGNEPKFMSNAGLHRPDGIILDLEDSVHPDHKSAARILVRNALREVDFGDAERMVRINQGALGLADLDAIVPELPDLVLIPKVESAEHVVEVSRRIDAALPKDSDRPIFLMPIIESALGVERAFEIASASDRIVALTLGLEDYTADLGVPKTFAGDESLYARLRVVNAARAAGLQAIDSVFGDVGNMAGLREWALRSRSVGFEGMGCIHPRQISVIHEAFSPTDTELARARLIVEAFEAAERDGRSVVSLGSRMIDPPVVLRAQNLVGRAERSKR